MLGLTKPHDQRTPLAGGKPVANASGQLVGKDPAILKFGDHHH